MATLKICVIQFVNGFKDSIFGFIKFIQKQNALNAASKAQPASNQPDKKKISNQMAKKTEKLHQRLIQSCILNAIFLLFCILIFNYALIPLLNYIAFKLISEQNHNLITDYLNPIIQLLFSFVWILPVFLLSKIFNLLVHQEIADIAYEQKYGKPKIFQKFTLAQVIADTVFSSIMGLIFLVQSSLIHLIPYTWLHQVLCHVHLSFLYSLYSFEYKLCNLSWDIRKRIFHIESTWPYYLGFGLSLSLILSAAGSYIYSATLFASIFPAFILSAIEADSENLPPVTYQKRDQLTGTLQSVPLQLPLFKLSIYLTDLIFKIFSKKTSKLQNSNTNNVNKQQQAAATFTIRKVN